ncbi:MAG TPA: tellurite resistance/C4-dicarboxylate transporter family protein [Mycobacteriales bacterium]|nr:tellurite resistance/C4-dicarboxylate transporter family protein [Mycobacteriales bacterium]
MPAHSTAVSRRHESTWRRAARDGVRTLNPGYFALVMATGIVSTGVSYHDVRALSAALLVVAAAAYLLLVGLHAWRIVGHPAEVRRDLTDPTRGFGFFTFVAASNVLGARLALDGHHRAATGLLAVGGLAWLLLGYLVPWTAVLGRARAPVLATANGTWFIWVVASQSVAVLAAGLEPLAVAARPGLALVAVVAWSVGVFLYAAAGIFVAARLMLYELRPAGLTPPYWVAMGATAIIVVAGARIVQMADAPMVSATRGLIAGTSVVFWAFGSWLIPPLVAAGWWRHVTQRIPLTYDATWWSIVLPLGMYGVAGHYLGDADRLPVVAAIGRNETWLALAVWALAFAAMLVHVFRTVARPSGEPRPP